MSRYVKSFLQVAIRKQKILQGEFVFVKVAYHQDALSNLDHVGISRRATEGNSKRAQHMEGFIPTCNS